MGQLGGPRFRLVCNELVDEHAQRPIPPAEVVHRLPAICQLGRLEVVAGCIAQITPRRAVSCRDVAVHLPERIDIVRVDLARELEGDARTGRILVVVVVMVAR